MESSDVLLDILRIEIVKCVCRAANPDFARVADKTRFQR